MLSHSVGVDGETIKTRRDAQNEKGGAPAMMKVFATMIQSLVLCGTLAAADHLVTDKGELARAVTSVKPGESIILRDGIWQDVKIRLVATGQAEKPITLKAQTPGKVTLSGNTSIELMGAFITIHGLTFEDGPTTARGFISFVKPRGAQGAFKLSSNCRITQCAFVDRGPEDNGKQYHWITLYGKQHEVDHCYFTGFRHAGHEVAIHLHEPSPENGHRIHHNHFAGRPELGRNGAETIYIGGSGVAHLNSRSVIEYNLFAHCNGEGEIITNKSCENVYRNNTFKECEGALTLRHGDRCVVEENFFLGNNKPRTGGVRVIGRDHTVKRNYFAELAGANARSALSMVNGMTDATPGDYCQVENAVVASNTFVNCRSIAIGLWKDKTPTMTLPPKDCTFASNILLGTAADALGLIDQPINMAWRSNIVWNGDPGSDARDGFLNIDPGLVEGTDGIFRLPVRNPAQAASGRRDAGHIEDGDSKPKEDSGSRQHGRDGRLRRPLTPHEVGPLWMKP